MASPLVLSPAAVPLASPPAAMEHSIIDTLKAMFPHIDVDLLGVVLSIHGGQVELAVASLLEQADVEEHNNTQQMSMDEQAAAALQAELDAEARAETEAAQALSRLPATRAVAAVDKAKDSTKRLIARMRSARRLPTTERSVRLLDADSADIEGPVASPLAPLYEAPQPLPAEHVSSAPLGSLSDSQEPAPTTDARYAARVGRARAANQARARPVIGSPKPSPEATPVDAPHVPVAELI